MSKKLMLSFTTILCILLLSACGLSDENIAKVKEAQSALTKEKENAEDIYGKLTTDSFLDKLTELSTKYDEYKDLEVEKLRNKHVEDIVSGMGELTDSYKALGDEMNTELQAEEAAAAESAKHVEILCYIQNKSGLELSSIIFHDNSQGTDTANMLLEGHSLYSGRTLEGVVLPVNTDSSDIAIVVTDNVGNETTYPLTIVDIASATENGISITLGSPEDGAEISNY